MMEDDVVTRQRLTSITARLTGGSGISDASRDVMVGGMVWSNPNRPLWLQRLRSMIVLVALGVTAVTSSHQPIWSGAGISVVALATICVASRIPIVFRRGDPVLRALSLLVSALTGVGLALLVPRSGAIVFAGLAVINATELWSIVSFTIFTVGLSVIYVVGQLALGRSLLVVVIGPAALAIGVLMGLIRRQSADLAAEAALVRDSQAHSAALDERARIAREIHDVLAHSLAALTVQLETADALLESGRTVQAHASVLRASQLAREGLAETRRAIGALRGETMPLPALVDMLASAYRADLGGPVTVQVDGVPRDLRPDIALALYRTAQEAITNVRKHAPGAPLSIELHYGPGEVGLDVTNGVAASGDRPLASTGGGYGLTGLRERAELAGGSVDAGPAPDGWLVSARIPT
jgi:signal transduction histidine kinase